VVASRYADSPLIVGLGADACEDMGQRVASMLVHFDFDKSEITDAGKSVLGQVVDELRSLRGSPFSLEVQGHCDNRGTVEYNLALGENRARTVREYLTSVLGSVEGEIRIISYGEERPLIDENNEKAWAMNRRAQFVLTCPGG
jgi:peptidoglycan-associated lipoprotein